MKRIISFLSFIGIIGLGTAQSQCVVNVTPSNIIINCGQTVDMTALGTGNTPLLTTNFDNGTAGPGWVNLGGAFFSTPCGQNPTGTPYYWASTSAGTPMLQTVGFDVSCGGYISFDMAYATQGGASPCEGPDLPNEGVTFQYSTDGGLTWVTIQYWDPQGGYNAQMTSWNTYTFSIPPAAIGPNTMFRWIQFNSSGTCCDNWGLDNVTIDPGLCGTYWYDWAHVPGSQDSSFQSVAPSVSTQYPVLVTNGVDICYDTVNVIVNQLTVDATTSADSISCIDCVDLNVTVTGGGPVSINENFDPMTNGFWSDVQSGTVGGGCGSMSGNALHFDGAGANRYAATGILDATQCGLLNYCLFMGNNNSGGAPCENADAGDDLVVEYSIDFGVTWTVLQTYDESLWDNNNNWQCYSISLPGAAQTQNTILRWRQIAFDPCVGCDNWSLDNVTLPCVVPAVDYLWSPAASLNNATIKNPEACPVAPTNFLATVTNPLTGCSATDSVFVNVTCECMFPTFTADVTQCENGNSFSVYGDLMYVDSPPSGSLIIEVTNNSGTFTQTIPGPFNDGVQISYTVSGVISDGSPFTVTAYFSDETTCNESLTGTSAVLPEVTATSGSGIYCVGEVANSILVDVTGNGPWTVDYTVDGVAYSASGSTSPVDLGNLAGDYVITNVSDSGCTNTASGNESIEFQALPTVTNVYGGDDYCLNDPVEAILVDVTGTAPWTIDFTINGTPQSVTSNSNPVNLGNVPGVYVVTGIADTACSNTASGTTTITIHPLPNVSAGNDFVTCDGDEAVLTGSGAMTYEWDNNVVNNVPFIPTQTATYTVVGTDANGCQNSDQVVVTHEPLPEVSFVSDVLQGCEPLTVEFVNTSTASSPFQECIWEFENGATTTGCDLVTHTFESGGLYTVSLTTTTINGCTNSVTYPDLIYVEDNPIASFTASSSVVMSLDPGVQFSNTSTGAVNYVWDMDDGTSYTSTHPFHEFPDTETAGYVVTLIAFSPIGCSDTVTKVIQVNQEIIFYLPNSFTPDGDEFNQAFQPVFTAGYDPFDFEMLIFNRWGQLIWESHDASVGWDGTYNGEMVPSGSYVWKIEFKTELTDERKMYTGHLNVLR